MAPNHYFLVSASPTPAFLSRFLSLPAMQEALDLASTVYDNTKGRNEVMDAALRAAEASVKVAASGAVPLATPFVNRVGGWQAVDQWACRGLDQVEKVAPIITKPTQEIVQTTRKRVLGAVAGDASVTTLTAAINSRVNQTSEVITSTRGGKAAADLASNVLTSAHTVLDSYLPPHITEPKNYDAAKDGVRGQVVSLVTKTRGRLARAIHVVLRPEKANLARIEDEPITFSMLVEFSRSTAINWYQELRREPRPDETVPFVVTMGRVALRVSIDLPAQLLPVLQGRANKLVESMNIQNASQFARNTMTTARNLFMLLSERALMTINMTPNEFAMAVAKMRIQVEDSIRNAMAAYEEREAIRNQQRVQPYMAQHQQQPQQQKQQKQQQQQQQQKGPNQDPPSKGKSASAKLKMKFTGSSS